MKPEGGVPIPRVRVGRAWVSLLALAAVSLLLAWLLQPRPRPVAQLVPTPAAPAMSSPIPTGTSRPNPTETPPATATPTSTPTPIGGGGVVVYDAAAAGNRDLYLVASTGGSPVRLTSHPAEDRAAAVSPDGTRIAFESRRDGNWELYVLDTSSGELRRLTDNLAYDGEPAWSPDGTRLAFTSHRRGDLDIFVLDLRNDQVTQLTDDPFPQSGPAWAPDGRSIAFVAWRNSLPGDGPGQPAARAEWNREIFLVPAAGGEAVNLTRDPADDFDPAWLPGTPRLAFVSDRAGAPRVHVLDVPADLDKLEESLSAGAVEVRTLLGGGDQVSRPAWAPDGQALAYVVEGRGGSSLAIRGVAAGAATTVVRAAAALGRPAWRPELAVPVAGAAGDWSARWVEPDGVGLTPTPAFVEAVDPTPESGAAYSLKRLPGVTGGIPRLSDRVDDSFMALRARVQAETGRDFLATLSDGLRPISYRDGDSSYRSWHKTGRAVDLNLPTTGGNGQRLMVLVREDRSGRTWWRIYLRAARQDGSQGEPLKVAPWELSARLDDRAAAEAGGRRAAVPAGYWIDFTALAAEYGWQRIPANDRPGLAWREDWSAIEYWHFEKRGGLNWMAAMREIYDQPTLDEYF